MESIYAEGSPCMGQGFDRSLETTEVKNGQDQALKSPARDISLGDVFKVQTETIRDAQGHIDYEFYHRLANRLRSEKFFSVGKAIMRFFTEAEKLGLS
jgi:hypothetical protein